MTRDEKLAEADRLETESKALRQQVHDDDLAIQRARPLADRLRYAATSRCPCGAGMAYDPAADDVQRGDGCWDCSTILLGTAIESGQPGAVTHSDRLPFRFWEIKSEDQPSAHGQTTRPQEGAPS